jgi:copper(I)-binding protein
VSRNSRRAVATAVAGVLSIAPLVTACAAGEHPQSALPTRLAEGVNASVHQVDIRNAFLLGPAPGQRLTAGGSAPLYAWFNNNAASPDRLIAAEAPGVARSVEIAGGAVTLPAGQLVGSVQSPGAQPSPSASPTAPVTPTPTTTKHRAAKPGTPQPSLSAGTSASGAPGDTTPTTPTSPSSPSSALILNGLMNDYSGGENVKVTLHFEQAGAVTLNVPVVPRNGYYATYAPAAVAPAPSATPLAPQSVPETPVSGTARKIKAKAKKKASAAPSA